MATITTRSGKGSALTSNEVDANFENLNTEVGEALPKAGGALSGPVTTNSTIDGRDVAADGTTADAALPKAGGAMSGPISTNSTFDGRDVATDGTKLDGIEADATADQTGAQIKTAYEAESNAFTDAQFTKLAGVEASADVTDAENVNSAGAVMNSDTSSAAMSFVIDEDNMVSDSATKVPTQQSVKAYVDGAVSSSVIFKGGYNAATNTPDLDTDPSGVLAGWMYTVTTVGTFFTVAVEIGDSLIAQQDDPDAEGDWTIVNKDLNAASIKVSYESNANTNAFTDDDHTKLDGIEADATADQTGAQIKTAYEGEANAFTDAQFTKLGGIEASADVTDTANVTSAGALMDSELTDIAAVKALDQGVATTDSPTFEGVTVDGDALTAWAAGSTKFVGSKFSTTYDLGMYMDTDNRTLTLSAKAGDSTGTITFQTGVTPTDRMRIDSSGNVLVGGADTGFAATKLKTGSYTTTEAGLNILTTPTGTGYLLFGDSSGAASYRGQLAYGHTDDAMRFVTAGTQRMVIDNDGDIIVSNSNIVIGTSGKGIDFSATAGTGTSELLDDYEEGTWTPTLALGTHTYTEQTGKYTKVGNVVTLWGKLLLSARGSSGSELGIGGLPFASAGSPYASAYGMSNTYGVAGLLPSSVLPTGASMEGSIAYLRNAYATNNSYTYNSLNSAGGLTFTLVYRA